jgi:hypothetical protein
MKYEILDFNLLLCSECRMLSARLLTAVCSLNANISEHSVCSICIGGSVWNVGIQTKDASESPRRKHTTKCEMLQHSVDSILVQDISPRWMNDQNTSHILLKQRKVHQSIQLYFSGHNIKQPASTNVLPFPSVAPPHTHCPVTWQYSTFIS